MFLFLLNKRLFGKNTMFYSNKKKEGNGSINSAALRKRAQFSSGG
jgi:hypothetical protein